MNLLLCGVVLGVALFAVTTNAQTPVMTIDDVQKPNTCNPAAAANGGDVTCTADSAGAPHCVAYAATMTFSGVPLTYNTAPSGICTSTAGAVDTDDNAVTYEGPDDTNIDTPCNSDAECTAENEFCTLIWFPDDNGAEVKGTYCIPYVGEGAECSATARCDPRIRDGDLRNLVCEYASNAATTGTCQYQVYSFDAESATALSPNLVVEETTDRQGFMVNGDLVENHMTITTGRNVLCSQYLSPVFILPMRETIGGTSIYRQARFYCYPPALSSSGIVVDAYSGIVHTGHHDVGIALAYPKDADGSLNAYVEGFVTPVHAGIGMDNMYVNGNGPTEWEALWHSYLYFGPLTVERTYTKDDVTEYYLDQTNIGLYSSAVFYGTYVYVDVLRASEDDEEWEGVTSNSAGVKVLTRMQLMKDLISIVETPEEDDFPDTIINYPFARVKGVRGDKHAKDPFSSSFTTSRVIDPKHSDKKYLDFDLDGQFSSTDIIMSILGYVGSGIMFTEHRLDHTNNDVLSFYDPDDAYDCYIASTGEGAKGTKNAGVVKHTLEACEMTKRYKKKDGFHEIKSKTVKNHRYWPVFVNKENPSDSIQFCGHAGCNIDKNTVFATDDGSVVVWVNTLVESAFYPPQNKLMHGADIFIVILATLALISEGMYILKHTCTTPS
jgi:hypothetical protein